MPELPEVETIRKQLANVLIGLEVAQIFICHTKSCLGQSSQLVGQKIIDLQRKAKILRINLTNDLSILIHLKMSGQLIYVAGQSRVGGGHPTEDWIGKLPSQHTRIYLEFSNKAKLFFNDQRIFGWWKIMSTKSADAEFAKLAPDIIDKKVDANYFIKQIKNSRKNIKTALMDGSVVSGVGNIYACDGLHLAKVHPESRCCDLTDKQLTAVFEAAKTVILLGIKHGGATTDGKYRNIDGLAGSYQSVARVYDREGQKCPVCETKIDKMTIHGRGTYFCPKCQAKETNHGLF